MRDLDTNGYSECGKRLAIEIGAELQLEVEGLLLELKSVLVGMQPGEYLIVKAPGTSPVSLIRDKFAKGNFVVVRYLHQGAILGFQSQLLGAVSEPEELLFIEYPKTIKEYNRRSAPRMDYFLPAKIKIRDREIKGTIVVISPTGCRCTTETSEVKDTSFIFDSEDSQITLTFLLPGVEREHSLAGRIRNIRKDGTQITIGIEFDKITTEAQNRLLKYLLTTG